MTSYYEPIFDKTVAPGTSTHHCKTKMVQNANDRELSCTSTQQVVALNSWQILPIHNLNKALNNNMQLKEHDSEFTYNEWYIYM